MAASVSSSVFGNSQLKIRSSSAGVHFFDRATGLNILIDEIKPLSKHWSVSPRQVSVALTNACDLSCSFCYAPKTSGVLEFDKLTDWLIELDENGCMGVGFGGGEPTLYPRLAELCSFATNNTNLAATMTTHAHRLSDHLLAELSGNLNFVRVSMDGIGSTYETIRGRSFDELLDRIKALSKITRFGINFVVNSKTVGELQSATELAEDLGAVEFLLLPEEPTRMRGGIDKETSLELRKWVNEYDGKVALAVSENHTDGLPACSPLNSETGLAAFAHVDASGVLKQTSYDLTGVKILGDGILTALRKLKETKREANE